jgi:hypothetical protein
MMPFDRHRDLWIEFFTFTSKVTTAIRQPTLVRGDVMNIAVFVAKVANPYFTSIDEIRNLSRDSLESALEFAVRNKIFPLFHEGCGRIKIGLSEKANILMSEYEQRRRKQLEAAKLLLDIYEKQSVELLFFKTFKPFNYVPDDIDILLRYRDDLDLLIRLLEDEGYRLLKIGTPEVSMRKIGHGTFVDIDIHTSIAAGHLPLLRTENLWRNCAYKAIDGGYEIPVLSEHYEVIREAAYSLLKDFTVSIPGLYLAINAIMKENLDAVRRIAEEENLLLHVNLFLDVAYLLVSNLFGSEVKSQFHYEARNASELPLKLVRADLHRGLRVPYPYPLSVIALAYLSKVRSEMYRDRNLNALIQLIKQPSSKGIGILLDYVRERLH